MAPLITESAPVCPLEERLALLQRLIADHSGAVAACINERFEVVERPLVVEDLGYDRLDAVGTILAEIVPDDQAMAALIWDRANLSGIGQGLVRFAATPEERVGLHIISLMPEHGVFVCIKAGGPEAVPVEAAAHASRTLPPRRVVHHLNDLAVIQYADPGIEQILGWTSDEMEGTSALEFIHPDDHDRGFHAWVTLLAGAEIDQHLRLRYRKRDGEWHWFEIHHTNYLRDQDKGYVESELIDVNDEMMALAQLRAGELQFRTLTESLPVGVLQLTRGGEIVYTNRWLRTLAGDRTDDEAEYDWSLVHEDDIEKVREAFSTAVHTGTGTDLDARLVQRSTGRTHHCRVRVRALVADDEVSGAIASVEDVTESMSLQRQLRHQASSDPLTGLANRRELVSWLNRSLDESHADESPPTAVLFVDLDGFKLINDALGHDAGDELLVAVADRIRGTMRPSDILARFGGDEFVVACPGVTSAAEATAIADRVLAAIDGPIVVANTVTTVGCSIGVAIEDPDQPADASLLISNADLAMYQAKRAGGGRWTMYGEPLRTQIRQRFEIQRHLRTGIDEGQFQLHIQPVFELATGRPVAGEALVRWDHPEWGLVTPDRFVSVAEESGQMVALGNWIIDDACRIAARAADYGLDDFRIAINLSGRQLAVDGFEAFLAQTMARHGVEPTQLILEVTEAVFIDTRQDIMFLLTQLAAGGLTVALDDFGTGYSSLNHLRLMPATMVKIDSTYIAELGVDNGTTAIVEAMVGLTRRLGLELVAEGIESEDQREQLIGMGVRLGQGYLLAGPMAEDEFFASLPDMVAENTVH